jgi:hypothetical protein
LSSYTPATWNTLNSHRLRASSSRCLDVQSKAYALQQRLNLFTWVPRIVSTTYHLEKSKVGLTKICHRPRRIVNPGIFRYHMQVRCPHVGRKRVQDETQPVRHTCTYVVLVGNNSSTTISPRKRPLVPNSFETHPLTLKPSSNLI